MRILIIGGGKTGAYLATRLEPDHDVTLIEQRHDRVEWVRAMLPDINVIEGDACEPLVLESAGIREVDLVAAVTGDDEDNLVVAMLARIYDVKTVHCRVNHPKNEWLFDREWGVDIAVSAPKVLAGLVEKETGFGDLIGLLRLNSQNVNLDEFTLPADASKVGCHLQEVELPANVTVMAILAKDGYIQAPRGNTLLVAGDQLLLLVEGEADEAAIRSAFGICSAKGASASEESAAH